MSSTWLGETRIPRRRATPFCFSSASNAATDACGACAPGMPGEQPQRTAVDGQAFDVENFQSMPREQRLQRDEAEIKNVFVINRVELRLLDEIHAVGKFQDDAPVAA